MTNFAAARTNMVDSQIHPMGVVSEAVLDAFRTVPREDFVPPSRQAVAYNDEDMPIGAGRFLVEPLTHARLIQAAQPVATDVVLDIGSGTGYSSAILSSLVAKVIAVEPDAQMLSWAEQVWKKSGLSNIIPHQGPFDHGCATHGPYSLILFNGSIAEIPATLLEQLAPHGRIVAVVKKQGDKIGHATLALKSADGVISRRVLFDAAIPYLPGHAPNPSFVF